MLFDTIKTGDRVEIQQNNDADKRVTYVSQVESTHKGNQVVMHLPISYGQLIQLRPRVEYRFLFFTDKGMARFIGVVEKRMKEGRFELMLIKLINEGVKIQRRDFFRFPCVIPLQFTLLDTNTMQELRGEVYSGITKDIGGGGICFLSNEMVEEGSNVKIVVNLNNDTIVVIGEIIQRSYFPKSNYRYQYRAGFIGIRLPEQEKIVQYIFNEQKKSLQRVKGIQKK